jgi:hypothetical protein
VHKSPHIKNMLMQLFYYLLIFVGGLTAPNARSQTNSGTNLPTVPSTASKGRSRPDTYFTTPEIKQATLQVMIDEANRVAHELNLPEPSPITKRDVPQAIIDPPFFTKNGSFGTISTSNFIYYFTAKKMFAGLDNLGNLRGYGELKPSSITMDTNAAFSEGCRMMRAVSFDVDGLNRDFACDILAVMPYKKKGLGFVYTVNWSKNHHTEAIVQFMQPSGIIMQMHMYTDKYTRRKPLEIPNLEKMLRQGSAPETLLKKMGFQTNDNSLSTNK